MNRGRIEQVGAPDEIYRQPKSEFVADFLGAANVVAATALGGPAFASPLGRLTAKGAKAQEGDKVKLAWRPEDMRIAGAGKAGNRVAARIESVVFRGNFIELAAGAAGTSFKAQVANDSLIKEGDSVTFIIPEDRLKVVE
jgi:ABC-type Fe3+/spermidine/putrescine transport system ATPase subunit